MGSAGKDGLTRRRLYNRSTMSEPEGTAPEAYLVVTPEAGQRRVHRLDTLPAAIGRAPDSDIQISDPAVSRTHARIDWDGARFTIEDLESTNGTSLNGAPLSGATGLTDGDTLSIAGVRAEFQVNAPTVILAGPHGESGLRIDLATHEVSVDGRAVKLSPKEYLFLAALHRHAGSVVGHGELAREVWPEAEGGISDENLHQIATRLRRKLEANAGGPRYVLTVKGFGYRLDAGS
jgi:pSer/pThr/pTyr-binding forkhead associated (FHA) protein